MKSKKITPREQAIKDMKACKIKITYLYLGNQLLKFLNNENEYKNSDIRSLEMQ